MNKIIDYFKRINVLYLYVLIALLLIFSIIISFLFTTKKTIVTKTIELVSNKQEEQIKNTIRVDVKGYVENPGVYELEENDRVMDAINKAGGLKENANTSLINLSMKIFDEMTIIIYSNEEIEKFKESQTLKEIEYIYVEIEKCPDKVNDACLEKETTVSNITIKEDTKKDEKNIAKEDNKTSDSKENTKVDSTNKIEENTKTTINENIKSDNSKDIFVNENTNTINQKELISINNATIEELQTLSGIGESKAKAIIKYREENGLFKDIKEITNISGIGEKQFEKIKDSITI